MFWGIEISKVPVKFTPAFDLHITTACLSAVAKDTGRNVLQVKYDGKTYSLCSLKLNATEHSVLDTNFEEGKEVEFSVSGNNTICLTGYFVDSMFGDEEQGEDEDNEEEGEGEDEDEEMEGEDDEEEDDEDEDEEDEDDEEDDEINKELERQILEQALKRKAQIEADKNKQQKKPKQEEPVKQVTPVKPTTPAAKPTAAATTTTTTTPTKQTTPAKPVTKPVTPTKPVEAAVVEKKKPTSSVVTLPSGLQYEDLVVGSGPSPKSGKKVGVKYIGKLTNGKTFDSSLRTPFTFRIGIREVIRGWDIGVASMKVGGKRRLTIPADLAYGRSGAPPSIPPNATLIFDVELVSCAQ
ncbi:hypothetical protein ACTFIY_006644 [Dictyostelium cf. discoideum]